MCIDHRVLAALPEEGLEGFYKVVGAQTQTHTLTSLLSVCICMALFLFHINQKHIEVFFPIVRFKLDT